MKEPVIVDSTCLIGLGRVGHLDLLKGLFEPVIIPPSVFLESRISDPWISVEAPANGHLIHSLNMLVDAGEAEAITLACEKNWLIVLDDAKARKVAKNMNLKIIGTAGILVRAKQAFLVSKVAPILTDLEHYGFYLSLDLQKEVLKLCGE